MKKSLKTYIKWLLTIALIIFAVYKAGLFEESGRNKFIHTLADVRIGYLLLSIFVVFLINLSSSIKWYMLLLTRKIKVGLWRLYAYYNIGRFFNLIFPTSFGGDVVRIMQVGKYTGEKETVAASVVVERFTGMLTMVLFAAIAIFLNIEFVHKTWLTLTMLAGILAISLLAWLIFHPGSMALFQKIFGKKLSIIDKIFGKIEKIREPIFKFKNDKKAIRWAMINSVIFQLLAVFNVWTSALAFSNELTFINALIVVPVILFIMNIPFSIGGIGLMEFAFVFTLPLFGVSDALALSTALLIRAKIILDSLIGGIIYSIMDAEEKAKPLSEKAA